MNKNCVLEETKICCHHFYMGSLEDSRAFKSQVRRAPGFEKCHQFCGIVCRSLTDQCHYRDIRIPAIVQRYSTVQSKWLTNCIQQLRKPRYLDVRTTSDHNYVCDISLAAPRANWVPFELESHTHSDCST